jgi:MerR family transcriptional regulator, copper efflux regulator
MLINELSKRTGVSIHTLRYYENYGLISGSSDDTIRSNNYKQYDEILVEKVEWIVQAKKAGFTLAEIKKSLNEWFSGNLGTAQKVEIVRKKIREVDAKIQELKQVRKFLAESLNEVENGDC